MLSLLLLLIPILSASAAIIAIGVGLVSAPWYMLLLLLAMVLVIARLMMPRQSEAMWQFADDNLSEPLLLKVQRTWEELVSPDADASEVEQDAALLYRGVPYLPHEPEPTNLEAETITLSGKYRGCVCPIPQQTVDVAHAEPLHELVETHPEIVLKYRGVKMLKDKTIR